MKRGKALKRGKGLQRFASLDRASAPLRRSEGLARGNGPNRAARREKAPDEAAVHSGPRRKGTVLACIHCGERFYVPPSVAGARKFCTQACMGEASRKARTRTCTVCGQEFLVAASGVKRKTCTTECMREAKRRAKLGERNPAYRGGSRQSARWREALASVCVVCSGTRRLTLHHVVYEQHVRRAGGDPWDPDDGLTVCFGCHMGHHHGADRRLAVSHLLPRNIEFAFRTLGPYAADYFTRYYDNDRRELLEARTVEMESQHGEG